MTDTRDARDVVRMMQSLQTNPGWELMVSNLQRIKDSCMNRLMDDDCREIETSRLRGYVHMLEYFLDGPERFIGQAEALIDKIERAQSIQTVERKNVPRGL